MSSLVHLKDKQIEIIKQWCDQEVSMEVPPNNFIYRFQRDGRILIQINGIEDIYTHLKLHDPTTGLITDVVFNINNPLHTHVDHVTAQRFEAIWDQLNNG